VANYADLVATLSAIHINDRKRHRVNEVAGYLIVYLLKEKCDKFSKTELQELLKASADRLWETYQIKRKDQSLLAKDVALQAINAEIEFLTKEFNL